MDWAINQSPLQISPEPETLNLELFQPKKIPLPLLILKKKGLKNGSI